MKIAFALLSLTLSSWLASPAAAGSADSPTVILQTSAGEIRLVLDAKKAPITVENFLSYVKSGHYDGTIFHRVIKGFMIQGGGMDEAMTERPTRSPIKNEHSNGLQNARGTISMARTSDPNSATAQFFINLVDNGALDAGDGYAVFGKVVGGMEVVDRIATVVTTSKAGHQNVPAKPIVIKKATLEGGAPAAPAKKKDKEKEAAKPEAAPKAE
jgi:peptidyl-prolyl cis-trans isomerase A (cyclophilin A)